MLSEPVTNHAIDKGFDGTAVALSILTRKIWLPRLVYDCLPYFYITAGFAAFFATLYISQWFWILPHYLLFSAGCIHLGVMVYGKRHDTSSDESRDTSDSD